MPHTSSFELALQDGAFVEGASRASILAKRLPPGESVSIPMKDDVKDKFVYRMAKGRAPSAITTDLPWSYRSIQVLWQSLGFLAGFDKPLEFYVWRRMSANRLDHPSITDAQRRAIMGHGADSRAFEAYYASNSTTVDVQAVINGRPEDRQ